MINYKILFPGILFLFITFLSLPIQGSPGPNVVTSIWPIHSLVTSIMMGVAKPSLLVPSTASPHTYTLKPTGASALSQARLVFWVGEELEIFLKHPIETLAQDALVIELMHAPGVHLLKSRSDGMWEKHQHHNDNNKSRHHEHANHLHDDVQGKYDSHLWLDPFNAKVWIHVISDALVKIDPVNAKIYKNNTKTLSDKFDDLYEELKIILSDVRNKPYIVFHDAYHYFENRFQTNAIGTITVSPERPPGAARLARLRHKIRVSKAVCVFVEPQFGSRLIRNVIEGTNIRVGILDPLGIHITDNSNMYFALLRNIAHSLKTCLEGPTAKQ